MSVPFLTKNGITDKKRLLFPVLFVLALGFCFFLAPYGWSGSDESFYIVEPYRLIQGDCFFVDDWNCGQLFSFLLLPLMWLRLLINPSTDGIILDFRYYYIVITALCALLVYCRTRSRSELWALFGALFILLYSPMTIRSLSYNAMGLLALISASTLAVTAQKHPFRDLYFSGLLIAALVLCCPFTVSVYIIYALFCLLLLLLRKHGHKAERFSEYAFSASALLAVTLGAGTLFILFCIFVFSGCSFSDFLLFFPRLFMDPEHKVAPLMWRVKNLLYCTITAAPQSLRNTALVAAALGLIVLDRSRMKHRLFHLVVSFLLSVLYILPFLRNCTNELMLPLSFLGLSAYLLSENKPRELFRLMFVPGIIYAVCIHHSSTLRFMALCNGFAVCSLASGCFIVNVCRELRQELSQKQPSGAVSFQKVLVVLVLLCLPLQLCAEAYSHGSHFFHDGAFSELDTRIDTGVEKGLITTKQNAASYLAVWNDTQRIRDAEGEYVLYISDTVWLPLGDSKRSANNSMWTQFDKPESSSQILREYLETFPEKSPEFIYITKTFEYGYQDAVDGMDIMDIINIENRPVVELDTGYIAEKNR